MVRPVNKNECLLIYLFACPADDGKVLKVVASMTEEILLEELSVFQVTLQMSIFPQGKRAINAVFARPMSGCDNLKFQHGKVASEQQGKMCAESLLRDHNY